MENSTATNGAPNLFQFAFLIAKAVAYVIGAKPLQNMLEKQNLNTFFVLSEQGNLTTNFSADHQELLEIYKKLFECLRSAMVSGFGEEYVKNIFLQNFEKMQSWVQTKEDLKLIKNLMPKFD